MILYKKLQEGGVTKYDHNTDTYWGGTLDEFSVTAKKSAPYWAEDFDKIMKQNPTDYNNKGVKTLFPGRYTKVKSNEKNTRDLKLANSASKKILDKKSKKDGESNKDYFNRLSKEEQGILLKSDYAQAFGDTIGEDVKKGLTAIGTSIIGGYSPVVGSIANAKFGVEKGDALKTLSALEYPVNLARTAITDGPTSFMDAVGGQRTAKVDMTAEALIDPLNLAGLGILSKSKLFLKATVPLLSVIKKGKSAKNVLLGNKEWVKSVTDVYKNTPSLQAKGTVDEYLGHVTDIISGKKPNQYGILYKNNKGPEVGYHFSDSEPWDRFNPNEARAQFEGSYQQLGPNLHLSISEGTSGRDWRKYARDVWPDDLDITKKVWLPYTENPYVANKGLTKELEGYYKAHSNNSSFDYIPNKWAEGLTGKFDGIVNKADNEFTAFNLDNLHLLGSEGDIKSFKSNIGNNGMFDMTNPTIYENRIIDFFTPKKSIKSSSTFNFDKIPQREYTILDDVTTKYRSEFNVTTDKRTFHGKKIDTGKEEYNYFTRSADNAIDKKYDNRITLQKFKDYGGDEKSFQQLIDNINTPSRTSRTLQVDGQLTDEGISIAVHNEYLTTDKLISTLMHEKAHQAKLVASKREDSLLPKLWDDINELSGHTRDYTQADKGSIGSYITHPTEVYSRIVELKHAAGLKLYENFTKELLEQVGNVKKNADGKIIRFGGKMPSSYSKHEARWLKLINNAPVLALPIAGAAALNTKK